MTHSLSDFDLAPHRASHAVSRRRVLRLAGGSVLGLSLGGSFVSRVADAAVRIDITQGNVQPINPQAFIEKIVNTDAVPRFADWRAINAQALVTGRLYPKVASRRFAEFR